MNDLLDDFTFHLKKDLDKMEALARVQGPCFSAKDVKTLIDQIHFRVLSEERRRRKKGVGFCGSLDNTICGSNVLEGYGLVGRFSYINVAEIYRGRWEF